MAEFFDQDISEVNPSKHSVGLEDLVGVNHLAHNECAKKTTHALRRGARYAIYRSSRKQATRLISTGGLRRFRIWSDFLICATGISRMQKAAHHHISRAINSPAARRVQIMRPPTSAKCPRRESYAHVARYSARTLRGQIYSGCG